MCLLDATLYTMFIVEGFGRIFRRNWRCVKSHRERKRKETKKDDADRR